MEATGGGNLLLRTAVTQGTSGGLESSGGGAVVMQGASVNGGSLAGGLLATSYGTTDGLDLFTIAAPGTVQVNDNSTLNIGSGIVNNGLMAVQTVGGAGNITRIVAPPPFKLGR